MNTGFATTAPTFGGTVAGVVSAEARSWASRHCSMDTPLADDKRRVIRSADIADRLDKALDAHPLAPRGHGRLTWLKNELAKEGMVVSTETVSKWFMGESKPHPKRMDAVAKVLRVDTSWLLLGLDPSETPKERKVRNAAAEGAVNLVAGLIQLSGGAPAFPEDDDPRAKGVDLFAIIRGAQYAFRVVLAQMSEEGPKFAIPLDYDRFFVLGVVPVGGLHYDVVELSGEVIETAGVRRSGHYELAVKPVGRDYRTSDQQTLRQIESFGARL